MQLSMLAKRAWLLLFLAVIAFYFYGLANLPFVGPDEPRYAEVAREMFLRRDLITPTLGGHPWFEKPVLLYWMMMAAFRIFGVSEWAARLSAAVSGVLTIGAVYLIARRVEGADSGERLGGLARWSALVQASSAGTIVFSRGASFDIVLTMTITVALGFFLAAELESDAKRSRLLLTGFYSFVGLSLMAKGLVGIVIPFGVIIVYYALRRRLPEKGLSLNAVWGVPLALAVAALWYGPVIARHGWPFIDQFFIQHHFARYLSNKYHHPQRFYFYLPIMALLSLPWTPFVVDGLVRAKNWQWRSDSSEDKFRILAFAWLLVPAVFFSFSGSKLPAYVLPALPATALLAGERLARFTRDEFSRTWTMRATGVTLLLGAVAAIVYAHHSENVTLQCTLIVVIPVVVTGALAVVGAQRRTLCATLVVCATLGATAFAGNCAAGNVARGESVRDLIQLADARGYSAAPVFALQRIERTAEFYAAGRVAYGADGEPLRFEGPVPVAVAARRNQGPILVIVPVEYVWQLTDLPATQSTVIGNNGSVAIVAVRAE